MSGPRTPLPSPLVGEGAERPEARSRASSTRYGCEAGEGAFAKYPSPGRSLRSRPPSPARGEGTPAASMRNPTRRARELRSRMTDAERKPWFALRDRRFADFKFRRQVSLGPFIADFVCFDARMIVEVDGGQHAESQSDRRRDQWFTANNFVVMRYWNNDVLKNLEGVLTSLLEALHARKRLSR